MKRKNLSKAECPVARSLDVIGDWWSLLIIRDAFDGINRFSALQKNLGIARSMLTARLQELVEHRVLETAPASDGTAYQEYVLTEMGRGLFPVIVALRQWGEENLYQPGEQHSVLLETQTGKPVTRLELRSRENQVLTWQDTMVRKLSPDGKH
ncbi:DNA-binding HxlR family transcriptional regulator [Rheinheimera pacifica]|uniref:winged helix-turn-helix transcriptional regulator n=1 Tax=Rheinheimera pacifica TaxID=173990 RepID=UPI0028578CE1|nr:helix-turn-helix domain-containing protein [Rheinheimera pacifica]MDR6983401.1 DNA-binding HxlR family transcriptional regulator [Rheinheimera pacifica]